ncbi:DUF2520 domain-containing protein [Marinicella rhabdoformis]|uniref:DUF2520 domain-containing protein n=1 Tax=Marinicella rhabdoformis TaxID=2580566 RepID=UPI0012AED2DF|nr:DUF2520 domain-containing protein [Marinicella rhabdoformis]
MQPALTFEAVTFWLGDQSLTYFEDLIVNRQVPKRYCLIGDGKVARHMAHYFDLLDINYSRWFRSSKRSVLHQFKEFFQSENKALNKAIKNCDHVLLLISDDQIESFIQENPSLKDHDLIHFSGALNTPLAKSCHPLMTFNTTNYDLQTYQNIPFVHQPELDFSEVFPALSNSHYELDSRFQSHYHAYCVMAGNFSQMMWRALDQEMESLGLPDDVLHAYIAQNTINYIQSPESAATGPFQRGDVQTIDKHLKALQAGELKSIYQAYLDWSAIAVQPPENSTEHKQNKKVAS